MQKVRGKYVALMPEYDGTNAVRLVDVFEYVWNVSNATRKTAIELLRKSNHQRIRQSTINKYYDTVIGRDGVDKAQDWRRFISKVCAKFGRTNVIEPESAFSMKYAPMHGAVLTLNGRKSYGHLHRSSVPQSTRCTWNNKVHAIHGLKSPAYYGK